jgi:hypothetical protein
MRDLYSPLRPRFDRDASEVVSRFVGLGLGGPPAFVGQIVADSKQPTAAGYYYRVNTVAVLGTEGEGNPASLVVDTTTSVLVCVIGTKSPSAGDNLICRFVENRWISECHGVSSPPPPPPPPYATIPGCSCSQIPATLQMSSSGPCYPGDFQAGTLQWGPTPSQFSSLGLGANCFLSTQDFQEPTQTPPSGRFRYTFGCTANFFSLSRVYEPTQFTQAYHDTTIYTWAIGLTGNSCSPFLLSNGTIYPGGSPNCLVVISQ